MTIKKLRQDKKKSLTIVADFLGTTLRTYKLKESGKHRYTVDDIEILAHLFKVSKQEIITAINNTYNEVQKCKN